MTHSRIVAALLLLVASLGGIMVGVALDRMVLLRSPFEAPGWGLAISGPLPPFRERIAHELDLSPEQRVRVDSVLERSHREFCAIQADIRPRVESVLVRTRRELEAVLTPEQRAQADKLKTRIHKFKEGRGMPGRLGGLREGCLPMIIGGGPFE
jgi:hypothetical protein